MKRLLLLAFALITFYLLFFPVPIDTGTWDAPENQGFTGQYEPNNKLSTTKVYFKETCHECESVIADTLGRVFGAAVTGDLWQYENLEDKGKVLTNTGGRPLGLALDGLGNLIVADAEKGLLSVNSQGEITTLTTESDGLPFAFTDDLEIGEDGVIYFSDASHKFGIKDYKLDMIEHRPNGRLLSYNPATTETKTLLKDLYFANGVAVSHEQDFVLVNETGKYRVTRYWLKGEKAGTSDVLIDNLPGFPDNISQGKNGVFWIAIISPRDKTLDSLMPKPFLRKIIARLPEFMKPKPQNYACVLGVNRNGEVVENLQDPNPIFAQVPCVIEENGNLYFGSLGMDGVGVYERK